MEVPNNLDQTLLTKDGVLGVIYMITNTNNNKQYIGQTVTHKLNCGKYIPFGEKKRLAQHISDALCNTKKKQCCYLNNSIRKNNSEGFTVKVLQYCSLEDANDVEIAMIAKYNTLAPNGYNLTAGGKKGPTEVAQRKKLAMATYKQYAESKIKKYADVKIDASNLDQYIYTCHFERYGGEYYMVKIENIRSIFVGKYISKEELKAQVYDFLKNVIEYQNLRHDQIAGTSSQDSDTTVCTKVYAGTQLIAGSNGNNSELVV